MAAISLLLERFADLVARAVASNGHFAFAVLIVLGWAVSGPHFGYSDTWQLVINTGTTIATYLIAILVSNNQGRQARIQDRQEQLQRQQLRYMLHLMEAVRDALAVAPVRPAEPVAGPGMGAAAATEET